MSRLWVVISPEGYQMGHAMSKRDAQYLASDIPGATAEAAPFQGER